MIEDLLKKVWREYTEAMMQGTPDVEAKYRTYACVFENYLRRLETS